IVDIENTMRHLNMGKSPFDAARDSAAEIAVPVLMATITTVVVFLPLVFMTGIGKYLFLPLAVSASLAMVASYVVSRTVSPLLASRFLSPEESGGEHNERLAKERFSKKWLVAALVLSTLGLPVWLADHLIPDLTAHDIPGALSEALPRD